MFGRRTVAEQQQEEGPFCAAFMWNEISMNTKIKTNTGTSSGRFGLFGSLQ